jgi:hypothetical protein
MGPNGHQRLLEHLKECGKPEMAKNTVLRTQQEPGRVGRRRKSQTGNRESFRDAHRILLSLSLF